MFNAIHENKILAKISKFTVYGLIILITGVAYITDKHKGNCSVRPIEQTDFDVRSAGPNDVRIRNSKEFWYFDTKGVTYEGVVSLMLHVSRDI